MSIDFSGKVALVTGAGTGIGRGTALVLARYGAAVAVAGRRLESLTETVLQIEAAGGRALPVRCDVSVEDDVEAMVTTTVERLGGLDIAVNNAAVLGPLKPIAEMDAADFEATPAIRVNGIRPGFVLTPMHDAVLELAGGATPERVAKVERMVPLGRRAEPEEIGEAVAWLCSPAAAYVTGEVITVDGGVTWSSGS